MNGYMRDHLTPVHRVFRLSEEVPPVACCMFPAPTIDSSEYTFGDIVGAAGCSKSRKRGGKFHVHEHFVIARACFIIFHSCPACR